MDTNYCLAVSLSDTALAAVAGVLGGLLVAFLLITLLNSIRKGKLKAELDKLRTEAREAGQRDIADMESAARMELLKKRESFELETESARKDLRNEEKRLSKREDMIDKKLETLNARERSLDNGQRALIEKEKSLLGKDRQLTDMIAQQKSQMLKVANMSMDDAKKQVISQVEKDMELETARIIESSITECKDTAEEKAREIILQAIQRYASDHTSDHTTSAIDVPSDDMKGRIIGREGRNIRAFENATGVDVIVDDTPGIIVCSSFDPVRREIARRSMDRLIQDGRVHPARIEEVVGKVRKEVNKEIITAGKDAALEANVTKIHQKLTELLGRLKFRTSYGQSVLQHSLEVAYLAQVIAGQLGLNGMIARRAGLLHDIGKAVDHEVEGGHPEIGADLLRRYHEREEVINAAAGHHNDVEATSPYTPIVLAADSISASRPGARRESLDRYVQRLEKLEGIASEFEGVDSAYAIQAGREVRVIVNPASVDDHLVQKMARDIAKQIEEEMEYPGEIIVTLIREIRCVDYAR